MQNASRYHLQKRKKDWWILILVGLFIANLIFQSLYRSMNIIGADMNLQSLQSKPSLAVGSAAFTGMALYALKARAKRSQSCCPANKTKDCEDISLNSV